VEQEGKDEERLVKQQGKEEERLVEQQGKKKEGAEGNAVRFPTFTHPGAYPLLPAQQLSKHTSLNSHCTVNICLYCPPVFNLWFTVVLTEDLLLESKYLKTVFSSHKL
jgi:hypothetical protein